LSNKFLPGKIIVISSPSGVGKTSICQGILTEPRKAEGWRFSISYTTRKKRPTETDGREYFFVSSEKFDELAQKDFFAEHFQVHLYKYGTPRTMIEETIKEGGLLLLDVDLQGALAIKSDYPDAVTFFILPPSITAWGSRLTKRGTETDEQLKVRFKNARDEVKSYQEFEHLIINDQLNLAIEEILCIITSSEVVGNSVPHQEIEAIVNPIINLSEEQIDEIIGCNDENK